MRSIVIDDLDKSIVATLAKNADISNLELANLIGLSPSACLRRVKNLKTEGIIRRIVAEIDRPYAEQGLSVVVTIKLERHGTEYRRDFSSMVIKESAVKNCYMVSGDTSCIIIFKVNDVEEYNELADKLFKEDRNVSSFTTHFVLSTLK